MATNEVGDGPLSSSVQIKAASPPDAPYPPVLISQMPDAIVFSWTEPFNNYDPILDYKVYWDSGLAMNIFGVLTMSTFGELQWNKDNSQMPELVPGTYYQFKVSAFNSIGESDLSPAISVVAATISDPPTVPT